MPSRKTQEAETACVSGQSVGLVTWRSGGCYYLNIDVSRSQAPTQQQSVNRHEKISNWINTPTVTAHLVNDYLDISKLLAIALSDLVILLSSCLTITGNDNSITDIMMSHLGLYRCLNWVSLFSSWRVARFIETWKWWKHHESVKKQNVFSIRLHYIPTPWSAYSFDNFPYSNLKFTIRFHFCYARD